MFLNEKLENIYNTVDDPKERNMQLANLCIKSIPKPEDAENMSCEKICSIIKWINNSWVFFCKKHPDLNKDWFKNFVKELPSGKLAKLLGWDK